MSYIFNLLKRSSLFKEANPKRKRIRDRGISWKQRYHSKSQRVKEKFEKILGSGSYYRWEGHDYTTNGNYFIVVGPSQTKEGKKKFFAGIKRYPDDPHKKLYAPYGEYFSTIKGALSHASKKWRIPFPENQPDYTEAHLAPIEIPRHVKG